MVKIILNLILVLLVNNVSILRSRGSYFLTDSMIKIFSLI